MNSECFICSYDDTYPETDKICAEEGYVVLNNYKHLIDFDHCFEWNISNWCTSHFKPFKDCKGIIYDGFHMYDNETIREVKREDLINLFFDLKKLRNDIISLIPEFFPDNISELSWFELKYTDVWKKYIETTFDLTFDSNIQDFHLEYYKNNPVEYVFSKYYENNQKISNKIDNLKFGNKCINEHTFFVIDWVFTNYEKLGTILSDSDLEWRNPKMFYHEIL